MRRRAVGRKMLATLKTTFIVTLRYSPPLHVTKNSKQSVHRRDGLSAAACRARHPLSPLLPSA